MTSPTPNESPRLTRRIAASFRPYSVQIVFVGLLILVTAGLGVINPLLIRVVFDSALFPADGGPNLDLLWVIAGVMAGITVVTSGAGIAQTYLTNQVGQKVMRDLRDGLYRHLQSLSMGFFTGARTGEIQSRVANDVGGVQNVVTGTVTNILSNTVILISTVAAMAILSWQLTLVAIGVVPVFAVITKIIGERRRRVSADVQKSSAEMTAITQETLSISGIMLSKLFGRQQHEIERFHEENQHLSDLVVRQQMTGQSFWAIMQAFFSISPIIIYLLAGYMISGIGRDGISAGTIVAFTTLQARLYFPIGALLQVSVELQSSMALFERIFAYMDIKPDIVDAPDAVELNPERVSGAIKFESVRLQYASGHEGTPELPDAGKPGPIWAVNGIDLEVRPGQLAALVGPSGSGKTTISYLIPRLYDVSEGRVLMDDIDVRKIRLASLSKVIGYVSQESYLFHARIRDNLLYSKPDATQEELESAAKAAYIHDRILQFPEGYDTVVGERGYRLSGGERQRLSIARVILRQPKLLVLDEATSSLDNASERFVQAALQQLMRGRTTVAIAHRLSTIMAADVIFAIDHGRIVEQGTHYQLLAKHGLYAQLYEEQFEGGRIECRCDDGIIFSDGTMAYADEDNLVMA